MIQFSVGTFSVLFSSAELIAIPVVFFAFIALINATKNRRRRINIGVVGANVTVLRLVVSFYIIPQTDGTNQVVMNIGTGFVEFSIGPTATIIVSSSQITNVSIVYNDTGLLVMSKNHGDDGVVSQTLNHYNVGVFTLANGATAYAASGNLTNLVVEIGNCNYLVLAPEAQYYFVPV